MSEGETTQTPSRENESTTGTSTVTNVTPTSEQIKTVPEKDLIAVKEGAERKLKELETEKLRLEDEYKQKLSVAQDEALKASAALKQLEEQTSKSSDSTAELERVKQELAAAQESRKELDEKLLVSKREAITKLGIPAEKLEGKTSEQLDLIEDALKSAGRQPTTTRLDTGGGAGSTATPLGKLDKMKAVLASDSVIRAGRVEKDSE